MPEVRVPIDLSSRTYAEAVDFLRNRATILDYSKVRAKGKEILKNATPRLVRGVVVKNKNGLLESVILCTTVWTDKPRMREAYTETKYDWMLLEVNTLWTAQDLGYEGLAYSLLLSLLQQGHGG